MSSTTNQTKGTAVDWSIKQEGDIFLLILLVPKSGLECSWEIGDGLTRNADLRQRLTDANSHSVDINMLVHDMRTNTDAVATTLLAKLRLGDSIEDLATGIRDGTSFAQNRIYAPKRRQSQQTPER